MPGTSAIAPDDAARRFVRLARVVSATQGGETVLMDVEGAKYHTLNDVAARIWDLLRTETTVEAIVTALRAEYELPDTLAPNQIAHDVAATVTQFQSLGLVHEATD